MYKTQLSRYLHALPARTCALSGDLFAATVAGLSGHAWARSTIPRVAILITRVLPTRKSLATRLVTRPHFIATSLWPRIALVAMTRYLHSLGARGTGS